MDLQAELYGGLRPWLREIRLLSLKPAHDESDPLEGTLRACYSLYTPKTLADNGNIDVDPSYVALSYEWGQSPDSHDHRVIKLNGHELQIRPNLAAALLCFRRQITGPLLIWIDSICINQNDVTERESQVGMMTQIYDRASGVWLWLGPAADQSDLAMDILDEVQHYPEDMKGTTSRSILWIVRILSSPTYAEHRLALCSLFSRSYWKRLWIVQEAIIGACGRSPVLQCGDRATALGHIFKLAKGIYYAGNVFRHDYLEPETSARKQGTVKQILAASETVLRLSDHLEEYVSASNISSPSQLLEMLLRYNSNLCSDPRDKLYALTGVLPQSSIRIVYTLSVVEVYLKAAQKIVTDSERYDLLLFCARASECNGEMHTEKTASSVLPSWAPDWSRDLKAANLLLPFHSNFVPPSLPNKHWRPWRDWNDTCLTAAATKYGEVTAIQQIRSSDVDVSWEEQLVSCLHFVLRYLGFQWGPSWRPDLLWSHEEEGFYATILALYDILFIPACRLTRNPKPMPNRRDFVLWCVNCLSGDVEPLGDMVGYSEVLEQPGIKLFTCDRQQQKSHMSKAKWASARETFGLCLAQARVGDSVALVQFCKYPVLLRAEPNAVPGSIKLGVVGECYIGGIDEDLTEEMDLKDVMLV